MDKKRKRDQKCFVPGCNNSYYNSPSLSLFSVPKEKYLYEKWAKLIPRRNHENLEEFSVLCENHFEERFIEKDYQYTINGKRIAIPRMKKTLIKNAFPTIFPLLPPDDDISNFNRDTSISSPPTNKQIKDSNGVTNHANDFNILTTSNSFHPQTKKQNETFSVKNISLREVKEKLPSPSKWLEISKPDDKFCIYVYDDVLNSCDFSDIRNVMKRLSSPSKMIVVNINDQSFSCSTYFNLKLIKCVVEVNSASEVVDILKSAENMLLCSGAGKLEEFSNTSMSLKKFIVNENTLYSTHCQAYASSKMKMKNLCLFCKSARKRLLDMESKAKHRKKIITMESRLKYLSSNL